MNNKTEIRPECDALEQVMRQEQNRLFRYACYRLGSIPDAEDVVQDVFVHLFTHPVLLTSVIQMKNYLYKSVNHACTDYMRRNSRNRHVPLDTVKEPEEAEISNFEQEFQRINALLLQIPQEQAEVILLRTVCDLSFVDISHYLNVPLSTVKSRFQYGLDKLKSGFQQNPFNS